MGHTPKHMRPRPSKTAVPALFLAASLCMMAAPALLMPFASGEVTSEKREGQALPQPLGPDGPNLAYLTEVESYFNESFALRAQLVEADAVLNERLFRTSVVPNVVVGRDGWLFYSGTLSDYRRDNPLSARTLDNAAFNLALVQEYAQAYGVDTVVAIAPNKNTLYGTKMPRTEPAGTARSNLDGLQQALELHGVRYVDLRERLAETDGGPWYFERDTHWNYEGAELAYEAILEAVDAHPFDYGATDRMDETHVGDLDAMLHPLTAKPEAQKSWAALDDFAYVGDAHDVEDVEIETASTRPDAEGRLLMMRDSFGNALLPFMATHFADATFSKMVPYNLGGGVLQDVDLLVLERAERHLSFFATDPPYMPAPLRKMDVDELRPAENATMRLQENGPYLMVEGDVQAPEPPTHIYVSVPGEDGSEKLYEAFHVSPHTEEVVDTEASDSPEKEDVLTDLGYRIYLPVQIAQKTDGSSIKVYVPA